MKKLLPLVLALASCIMPPPSGSSAAPNPGPEIIAAVNLMYEDLSSRRWEVLEQHFLPEATLDFMTPQGIRRMKPPEFVAMVRSKVEGKEIFEERMITGSVRAHEMVATVWSSFEGREGNGTDVREWSGVDAITLIKVDGRWRVSQITVSLDPPEPAETPEKK